MSGDSFPLNLPLSRFATDSCEATALYRELRKPLLRYLAGLGLSTDESQDVAQDAFLSLHKHLAAGGSQENIRSWLFRVAHNRARNYQQSYAQAHGRSTRPCFRRGFGPGDARTNNAGKRKVSPARHRRWLVGRAGTGVPDVARRRVALSRDREVLGIPTSTVADTVERAIKKLAEKCNV